VDAILHPEGQPRVNIHDQAPPGQDPTLLQLLQQQQHLLQAQQLNQLQQPAQLLHQHPPGYQLQQQSPLLAQFQQHQQPWSQDPLTHQPWQPQHQLFQQNHKRTICPFNLPPRHVSQPAATQFAPQGFQDFAGMHQVDSLRPVIYSPADIAEFQPMMVKHQTYVDALTGKYISLSDFSTAPVKTLSSWLDAFMNYAAVLLAHYPLRSAELLAYAKRIIKFSTKFKFDEVLVYDEKFRRQCANGHGSFGTDRPALSAELYLAALPPPAASRKMTELKSLWLYYIPGTQKQICHRWNKQQCKRPDCTYEHICPRCLEGHQIAHCKEKADHSAAAAQHAEARAKDKK
jgi:hypothetical protein